MFCIRIGFYCLYMYGDLREGEMNQNHGYVHMDIQSTADFVTSYHHIIYTISKHTYPVNMDSLPTQMMISIVKILKRITNTFFSIFARNEKKEEMICLIFDWNMMHWP